MISNLFVAIIYEVLFNHSKKEKLKLMKKLFCLSASLSLILTLGNFYQPCYAGRKMKFTHNEDAQLKALVQAYGTSNWGLIASFMQNRNERQCRERYNNYLNNVLSTSPWTPDEDNLLMQKYSSMGSKWTKISEIFPHRSPLAIKNRFLLLQRREKRIKEINDLKSKIESSQSAEPTTSTDLYTFPPNPSDEIDKLFPLDSFTDDQYLF